jgi:diaminopimelate decarboxylase
MNTSSLLDQRLHLFPNTTQVIDGQLTIAGLSVDALAEQYGTPLYIYDQVTLDASVENYRTSLVKVYPGSSGITYAGKAYLSLSMAQWTQHRDLHLDCTGEGEIFIATTAGVPRNHILVHGVNKSLRDLHAALSFAGTLVVDNLNELLQIIQIPRTAQSRVMASPSSQGLFALSYRKRVEDSKFGLSPAEFIEAVQCALKDYRSPTCTSIKVLIFTTPVSAGLKTTRPDRKARFPRVGCLEYSPRRLGRSIS